MILDWQTDAAHANAHEILDAATGEPLPTDPFGRVFYADDAAGVLRLVSEDERGHFYLEVLKDGEWVRASDDDLWVWADPDGVEHHPVTRVAFTEVRKAIRIVPKEAAPR